MPAWAVVIRARGNDHKWFFGGYLARRVHSNREIADFVGLSQLDSCGAELTGAIWAMMVALQYPGTPVSVAFDATYAAQSVAAVTNPRCNAEAVTLAAGLHRLLMNVSGISWTHVASHTGEPWNELADVLCGAAADGVLATPFLAAPISEWFTVGIGCAEWAFLHRPTGDQQLLYPVESVDGAVRLRIGQSSLSPFRLPSHVIAANIDQFIEGGDDVAGQSKRT